jgi:hypothetical protein
VHDFDPGIKPYPGGLFWTVPLSHDSVTVEFGAGKASMRVSDLALSDFFNIPNALFHLQDPLSTSATASFDITWSGPITSRKHVEDASAGFSGEFLLNQATMSWSASNGQGFSFATDAKPTTSAFAQLVKIQNGVFFGG